MFGLFQELDLFGGVHAGVFAHFFQSEAVLLGLLIRLLGCESARQWALVLTGSCSFESLSCKLALPESEFDEEVMIGNCLISNSQTTC